MIPAELLLCPARQPLGDGPQFGHPFGGVVAEDDMQGDQGEGLALARRS
ncbi:hypothetical protein [Streptomyces chartreusis]